MNGSVCGSVLPSSRRTRSSSGGAADAAVEDDDDEAAVDWRVMGLLGPT